MAHPGRSASLQSQYSNDCALRLSQQWLFAPSFTSSNTFCPSRPISSFLIHLVDIIEHLSLVLCLLLHEAFPHWFLPSLNAFKILRQKVNLIMNRFGFFSKCLRYIYFVFSPPKILSNGRVRIKFSRSPSSQQHPTLLGGYGRKLLTLSPSSGCILRKKKCMCGSDKVWVISGEDALWVRISYVYHLNPPQQAKITVAVCGQKFMKIIAWQVRVKVSFFQNMWRGRKRVCQVFCVHGCLGKIILSAR